MNEHILSAIGPRIECTLFFVCPEAGTPKRPDVSAVPVGQQDRNSAIES